MLVMGWGGGENQGSRLTPANKTPCGEGCRSLALFWGLLLFSSPSPFSFCLLSSLSVEAGAAGLSWCRRRLPSSERCGETLSRLGRVGVVGGNVTRPKPPAAAPAHAAPSQPHSLSVALKNRRAFVGARAGEEPSSPARLEGARARQGASGGLHSTGDWAGRDAQIAERGPGPLGLAPAAASFLPAPWKRRSGRGASAGGCGACSQVRAQRARPRRPARRVPAQPRHPPESSCFSLQLSRPARGASAPTPGEEPGESPVRSRSSGRVL